VTRGPCTFKQQDLVRALKGVKAAGIEVARIEIDKRGKIVISTPRAPGPAHNPYDAWKAQEDAS
jgi:hypothetical protein